MTEDSQSEPFEQALAALLRPLAQGMVARGVALPVATEALKQALFAAAIEAGGQTDSRVSLMTGLHRKDVKRLRTQPEDTAPRRTTNAGALAISLWANDPAFLDQNGQPKDLERTGTADAPGIDQLIRSTRADMAPGTVLRALLDHGAVVAREDGRYRLLTRSLIPSTGSAEQIAAFRTTLSAHLNAATHNLIADEDTPREFDRAVRHSGLTEESITRLDALAREKAQALLEELDSLARDMKAAESGSSSSGRFTFGAYGLTEPPEQS